MNLSFPPRKLASWLAAAVLLSGVVPNVNAATVATDNASNYTSFGNPPNPTNGGTGFGNWALSFTGNGGSFLDVGSQSISIGTKTWGLFSGTSGTSVATRPFTDPLSPGQVFQLDLQFTGITAGNKCGFSLYQNDNTTVRYAFYFTGGASHCAFDDNAGTNISLGAGGFPSGGFRVVFRLLTADTYELTVVSPNNGSIIYKSDTRTLQGTAGAGIVAVRAFNSNAGSGNNAFFNSLKIGYGSPTISANPAAATTTCSGTTTPAMTVTAASTDGSSLSYAWRKRGTGWGNAWTFNNNGGSHFLADSTDINSTANAKAWGLQQTTNVGGAAEAYRALPATLAPNQTVQLDLDNKIIASGGSIGMCLQNSSGVSAFEFKFAGGDTNYNMLDNSSTSRNSGIPFTSAGLRMRFTLLTSTTYSLQVTRLANGDTVILTGTIVSVPGGIQRIRFFDFQSGAGNNVYFNNLKVTGADDDAGNYATWIGDGGQKPVADGLTGNGSSYAGSTTPSFTLTSATASDSASYDCAVMSGQGYMLLSTASALTVNPNPTITTSSPLPDGSQNVAYNQSLAATGGTAPYTWTQTGGALPTGIALSSGGVLSGTPTVPGTYNFTVQAADNSSTHCTASKSFILTIACNSTITISPTTLSPTVAAPFSQQLSAGGGQLPYTFSVIAGTLPGGLSMTSAGLISGTATSHLTANFTVQASDANGCPGTQAYVVTPACPTITLSPSTLPNGTVATSYGTQTVTASGANGSYTFAVTSGTLPAGLSLNGSSGQITGTPTSSASQTFTITATDSSGCTGSQSYTITPACGTITLSPAAGALTAGAVGTAYTQTFSASGANNSFTYSKTAGTFPTGLTLSASTGVLSGTPTASGPYSFDITATDSSGCAKVQSYSLTMNCPTISVSPATLPNLVQNAIYSSNSNIVSASGGTGAYTFTISAGALPTGLAMDAAGVISGTPSASGTFTFTIQAADANSCTGSTAYTVVVGTSAVVTADPSNQTACSGSTATFSATASGTAAINYVWSKRSNAGWGNPWAFTGTVFRGSSSNNDNGEASCTSFSTVAHDINSPSGNALGMFGVASATRNLTAITTFPAVVSVDFDHGGIDAGVKNGFSLQTSAGADVLQFYFLGGTTHYRYNDGTERNTNTILFQRQGIRVKFILTSATTYKLLVRPCGGSVYEFNGTYSGTIGKLKLFTNNTSTGSDNDTYFNNFQIGGFVDEADNYSTWTGDKGDAPIATGNGNSSYITPALTIANNGEKYQVYAFNAYGGFLSSAATLTVNPSPGVFSLTGGGTYCSGGAGVPVGQAGSESGRNYQLYRNGGLTSVGSPVAGTGNAISFGNQTVADTYTVVATDGTTSCSSNMTGSAIVIVDDPPTTAMVAGNQEVCGLTSDPLGGNTPGVGTGSWSKVSGPGTINFSDASAGSSTATAGAYGTYALRWTTTNGTCTSSADLMVTFDQSPTVASAGPNQTQTETDSATLAANAPVVGVGTWSLFSGTGTITSSHNPGTTVTGLGYGANVFRWTITNGVCPASISDVSITRRHAQSISGLPATNTKTYGDAPYNLNLMGGDSGNPITYASSNPAVATVDSAGTVTLTGAGTSMITASQAGNADYAAAADVMQTLTVNQKGLTITGLTGDNKTYDGTNAATLSGTASLSGVINSDDVSLGGTPTATFADKNVGNNKPITVSGYTLSGTKAGSYSLSQPTGLTGNIAQKSVSVAADSGQFKVKGASDPTLAYTADSLFSGDNYSGALSRNPGETAGSYPINQGSLTAGPNYSISFTGATFVIAGPRAVNDLDITKLGNNAQVQIPLSRLLSNDSRIATDGTSHTDNLSITSVTSGATCTVSISGANVMFTPDGTSNVDTFTYTLTDSVTGATDTGLVTVTAVPFTLQIVAKGPAVFASGSTTINVDLIGVPNQLYTIQYSTDLSSWTSYGTANTGPTGAFTITPTEPGDHTGAWNAKMFFRASR